MTSPATPDERIREILAEECDRRGFKATAGCIREGTDYNNVPTGAVLAALRRLVPSPAGMEGWRTMDTALKDGSRILALLKSPIPSDREDLRRWDGIPFVARHPGVADDGFDIGWSFAAPVGMGGFPDEWFEGWQPLPSALAASPSPPTASPSASGGLSAAGEVTDETIEAAARASIPGGSTFRAWLSTADNELAHELIGYALRTALSPTSGKDTQPSEPSASAVRDAAKAVVDDAIIHTEPGQTQCRWCSEVFDADNNKHFKGCTIGALQSALKGREE